MEATGDSPVCRTYGVGDYAFADPALASLLRDFKSNSSAAKAVKKRHDLCRT